MIHVETPLAVPVDLLRGHIRQRAEGWDFVFSDTPDRLRVQMIGGVLTVTGRGRAARMRVEAESEADLQMLRDYLTEELQQHDLAPKWEGLRGGSRPANQTPGRVVSVARLSPGFLRVTLAGAELARFGEGGMHFRLLFGPEGAGWPVLDENGVTQWPGGAAAWHRPVYTVRHYDLRDGLPHLTFDVVIHDGGRVTDWCRSVAPGAEVRLVGPAGDQGRRDEGWQMFLGDPTALPVIARLLAQLPAHVQGRAVLFVDHPEDRQPLTHPAGVEVTWIHGAEVDFAAHLAAVQIPATDRALFAAGPRHAIEGLKAALPASGLDRKEVYAAAYW